VAAPWYTSPGPTYGTSPEMELDFLTNQASMLQQEMDQIQKRIAEIEKQEKPKKK
jgi:DNA-binding protein YbaB